MKSRYEYPPGLFGLASIVGGFAAGGIDVKSRDDSVDRAQVSTEPDYRSKSKNSNRSGDDVTDSSIIGNRPER